LTGQRTAIVLTSESGADENSLAEPTKFSPKTEAIRFTGASLTRSLPGYSLSVFRLQTVNDGHAVLDCCQFFPKRVGQSLSNASCESRIAKGRIT
jgi:hypothetical protein